MIGKLRGMFEGPSAGIAFMLLGAVAISVNDMLIKALSGGYPLHQMVFVRSIIGIVFTLGLVSAERAWGLIWPRRPLLALLRAVAIVSANMMFFMALAVLPLADATAIFYVAPLFITALSIPLLGERVGPRRAAAVIVGFLGVLVMTRPGAAFTQELPSRWVLALPVLAALAYALFQILTRKIGAGSRASVLALHIQSMFILVSLGFYLVAGDGRFAQGQENESLVFLLRPWLWPAPGDLWLFVILGLMSATIGYSLGQAYRLGDAATIAPYEYAALPLAVMWGYVIFGTLPGLNSTIGIALILGAGVYVFLRQKALSAEGG